MIISACAVLNDRMSLGMMLAIQFIIGQLNLPIVQLISMMYSLQDVKISLERIADIQKEPDEDCETRTVRCIHNDSDIHFNGVTFKYNAYASVNTLNNLTFTIPRGKVTAIVGTSGSGKTTILKLILGYYTVQGGCITIGTDNINNYNLKYWRSQCGVVMQEGRLFSESIARNIAIDDSDINHERLLMASKTACIYDFITSLPMGFNTIVGEEGVNISQGQKQRILIARAVYKNPQFIILDEATNALNAQNERDIVEHLKTFNAGRTVIVIAHRLSTVKNADQIVVIDSGEVKEVGNHSQLTALNGIYYRLVKNQLELGI